MKNSCFEIKRICSSNLTKSTANLPQRNEHKYAEFSKKKKIIETPQLKNSFLRVESYIFEIP